MSSLVSAGTVVRYARFYDPALEIVQRTTGGLGGSDTAPLRHLNTSSDRGIAVAEPAAVTPNGIQRHSADDGASQSVRAGKLRNLYLRGRTSVQS